MRRNYLEHYRPVHSEGLISYSSMERMKSSLNKLPGNHHWSHSDEQEDEDVDEDEDDDEDEDEDEDEDDDNDDDDDDDEEEDD